MKFPVFFLFAMFASLLGGCFKHIPDYNEFTTVFHGERTKLYHEGKDWTFADFLEFEIRKHPEMECCDLLKFCRQAAFGVHSFPEKSKDQFMKTFAAATEPGKYSDIVTVTSPDTARINIAAWKKAGLPPEWLFNMSIVESEFPDSKTRFAEYIDLAEAAVRQNKMKFSAEEFRKFADNILRDPSTKIPHSRSYLKHISPYRVISTRYFHTITVLQKAAEKSKFKNSKTPFIIAIDGRAASGKTTLANQLKIILNAGVIHMDDFFLPPEMRTKIRYEEPGGNIHYERFKEEILPYIRNNQAFSYRIFDCKKNSFNGSRILWKNTKWIIVEGAYSMHPKLGSYADMTVFFDIEKTEQMRRIDQRNGSKAAHIFQTRWIPLENRYIKHFSIDRRADLILL